ncbi:MAG: hypothetical protein HY907_22685 [Deltaproteobacteria bacterium]|nr:hypothetical protein [Deltaproteobacteria bacterium]
MAERRLCAVLSLALLAGTPGCGDDGSSRDTGGDEPTDTNDGGADADADADADVQPDGAADADGDADGDADADADAAADADADADADGDADASDDGGGGSLEVVRAAIGTPAWTVEDVQIFAGECWDGTIAPAIEIVSSILPDHRFYTGIGFFGPGTPHAPPYDHEITDGLTAQGIPYGPHRAYEDVLSPRCIFIAMLLIPTADAPVGSSPDFASGPILPSSILPIAYDGMLYAGEMGIDMYFDGTVPLLSTLSPPASGDGYSHAVLQFGENSDFAAWSMTPGPYSLTLQITDAGGAGWDLIVPFIIDPPAGPCATADDLLGPNPCPAGQSCGSLGYCRENGAGGPGAICTWDRDCRESMACLYYWPVATACRNLCRLSDGVCAAGEACLGLTHAAVEGVGGCVPFPDTYPSCNPMTSAGCRGTDVCYGGACQPAAGTTALGGSCSAPQECVPGATCFGLGPTDLVCRKVCWSNDDCDAGQICDRYPSGLSSGSFWGVCV